MEYLKNGKSKMKKASCNRPALESTSIFSESPKPLFGKYPSLSVGSSLMIHSFQLTHESLTVYFMSLMSEKKTNLFKSGKKIKLLNFCFDRVQ